MASKCFRDKHAPEPEKVLKKLLRGTSKLVGDCEPRWVDLLLTTFRQVRDAPHQVRRGPGGKNDILFVFNVSFVLVTVDTSLYRSSIDSEFY